MKEASTKDSSGKGKKYMPSGPEGRETLIGI